jgi:adenylate cyclase
LNEKLTAILAADVAGYSRLMGADEVGTLRQLSSCRGIMDGLIAAHRGRIFNSAEDSVVADFASAVDAVECAVAVQKTLAPRTRETNRPVRSRVRSIGRMSDAVDWGARVWNVARPNRDSGGLW